MRISDWSSDVCSSDLLDPCDGRIKAGPIGNIERYGKCFAALVGNRLCRVRDLFHYSAYHLAEIADTARAVDLAIRWGYGWRSEERRVGKECVRSCRSRWSPCH